MPVAVPFPGDSMYASSGTPYSKLPPEQQPLMQGQQFNGGGPMGGPNMGMGQGPNNGMGQRPMGGSGQGPGGMGVSPYGNGPPGQGFGPGPGQQPMDRGMGPPGQGQGQGPPGILHSFINNTY